MEIGASGEGAGDEPSDQLLEREAEGRGAASLDGKMIDAASERMARNVLTVADAIAAQA